MKIIITFCIYCFRYTGRKRTSHMEDTELPDGDVRDTIELALNISMPYAKTLPLIVRKLFIIIMLEKKDSCLIIFDFLRFT